ncbi:AgmX/PglI C-terminal domain-containing protein [Anaeromyxobacter oryzae]|uniref:Uncharacterized protein n=1 Tax=Anaeromyxobacter oryzae TaxID=2918170 RepID=A0ABM7X4V3_9BACT|nr:AgmX/PglI C-terminal domain-containing protein [Anaeromyxobacter oryzae]BDG06842.1 hypothetical protein AMOR_58380 [Anaeromyxobacter oryzae]
MRASLAVAIAAAAVLASPASAAPFPARSGESGLVDVPDGEVVGVGGGLLGAELRLDHPSGDAATFGPLPLYAVAGVTDRVEVGLTMREWGQPGDPRPARVLFGSALKLQLLSATEGRPALAVDGTLDRIGSSEVLGGRLIASTRRAGRLRFAAFIGGESGRERGLTYGGAIALVHRSDVETVLEALNGPRGANLGAAIRWRALSTLGMSLGVNYLPRESGFQVSLGFGFGPPGRTSATTAEPAPSAAPAQPDTAATPAALAFRDDRPRFRLRLRTGELLGTEPRHLQAAPYAPPALASSTMPGRVAPARAPALSVEDVLESQLREAESQTDARERRLRATADALASRALDGVAEGRRLDERERSLGERTQQLDARERRISFRGAPTQQQRQLESQEAQLAAQERQLAAQERSLAPAVEAAQGKEQDASAREDAERQEVNRLTASATSTSNRAQQLELRKQAVAAKGRQLAGLEARLVATGERIDAVEKTLRVRGERLDASQRRLDARAERLDLLERRAAGPQAGPESAGPRPADLPKDARAQKDKAVFVMVVKSPTAVVKERSAQAGAAAPAPSAAAASAHPGVAVEKAVAAATVVMFPTPASQISELDLETVDSIAKLAAREKCELLIWARAKDPSLMAEAQRRAAQIRSRVLAAAALEEKQIVTRITTRPAGQGVDVVISALRDQPSVSPSPAADAPATPAPAPTAPTAPAPALVAGETGRRQIREAVVAAQPSIEACVAQVLEAQRLSRAEGVLRLTVSAQGKVTKVATGTGDLAGPELEACLSQAAAAWKFPASDAEYVVDVPITIIRGGGAR